MIIHLDADAFFASVEQAADPRLRGKAIAVGGSKRGIIASASYEARKFGVYTPMPSSRAMKICPKLIIVPGDYERYEHFSKMMFSYAYDFTPEVEVGGIDEGYYDVRSNTKLSPSFIAQKVRQAIHQTLKITVSEGVGSNKLVAQVASKLKKPNNFIEVERGGERQFLAPLPNAWLPGIGPKCAQTLNFAGLATIDQIARATTDQLSLVVGSAAPQLWKFAHGIDERPVIPEGPAAKSYGEQETFNEDSTDEDFIQFKLRSIADRLMAKVRGDGKMIRTVTVRVRYNDMEEEQRSTSLQEPTSYEGDLYSSLSWLLKKAWSRRVSLRLVSVKVSNVYDALFENELHLDHSMDRGRKLDLSAAVDRLKDEFGAKAIMRGHDLWLKHREEAPPPSTTKKKRYTYHRPVVEKPATRSTAFLNFKSYYSLMDSLLSPARVVELAEKHGARAVAITDPNLHGAIPFYKAALASKSQVRPIIAAELRPVDAFPLNAYVKDKKGYHNLCLLLSLERLTTETLQQHVDGLLVFPAAECGPGIRYEKKADRHLYQIQQSIRTLTLLEDPHPEKRTGHYHFQTGPALAMEEQILDQCRFQFDLGGVSFPPYHPEEGKSCRDFLRELTLTGARRNYPLEEKYNRVLPQLEEELSIIAEVGYEDYFLITWQILQDCKARGIDWITRGSAADSLVCYCLGISDVCPIRFELYFRRFLNRDRMALKKLPDIDIDFAHDRRDEVVEMLLKKYGDHAAIVGGFNTYQGRAAVADIAKVLGVSEFQIRRLTERFPRTSARHIAESIAESVECRDLALEDDPYKTAIALAAKLDGFPRHAKMHPCGLVLSREPIHTLTPTFISGKGWPTAQFDMASVEAVGLVKMDILSQGGLAVMRDTLEILKSRGKIVDLKELEPWKNPEIWEMIAAGHSRGVHHIESPAMLTLSRMCGADNIDDLVAIVSVIRPGAANSCKKIQFARRCQGLEEPHYAHPSLEPVLRTTYGVVAYEEHILQICEAFAGMGVGPADILRRALAKERMDEVDGMFTEFEKAAQTLNRSEKEIAEVWDLIKKFQGYAFCRSHSTAYGIEAYQAAHLKKYYPKEFLACVLENGKGFYNKLVYSIECRRMGIGLLPPDVNSSRDCFYPEPEGIRVPVKQIKGLANTTLERFVRERERRPFDSVEDFLLRVQPSSDEMQSLLSVGAFDSIEPSRTLQFWAWKKIAQWPQEKGQGLLFAASKAKAGDAPDNRIEPQQLERLRSEMELLSFTVSAHPLSLYPDIPWNTYCPISELPKYANQKVTVCGLIIEDRTHHQMDGRAMKFISLCDWHGIIEAEIFADTYRLFGINTIRYPVVEVDAVVKPYENGKGFSLDVIGVYRPRGKRDV